MPAAARKEGSMDLHLRLVEVDAIHINLPWPCVLQLITQLGYILRWFNLQAAEHRSACESW